MQISLSLVGLLSDTGGRSPVDATVKNLAKLRDEGFRRVWMTQMPYDPDLLTHPRRRLARGRHHRGGLRGGADPGPASDAAGAARADAQRDRGRPVHPRHRHEPSHGHRTDVGHLVRQTAAPDARVPRRPAAAAGRAGRRRGRGDGDDARGAADSRRADAGRVHRRARAADAAAGGAAHGGHADVDDRTQDARRTRRPDAARGRRRGGPAARPRCGSPPRCR